MPKFRLSIWVLDTRSTGSQCPSLVFSMPITWSLSARLMGTGRPLNGLWQTILWTLFLVLYHFPISYEHEYFIFFPMSMGILSFFHAYFKHISAYFSGTNPDFDDTSPGFMILRWYFFLHFLEKSHSDKVLNINEIPLYFSRRMILWDFFWEKTFLRERIDLSFVLQFSAVPYRKVTIFFETIIAL